MSSESSLIFIVKVVKASLQKKQDEKLFSTPIVFVVFKHLPLTHLPLEGSPVMVRLRRTAVSRVRNQNYVVTCIDV